MSFLKNFERRIEGLIEGVFKNKFSAQIQPIELAKHVVNVMEDQKKIGADGTLVPGSYEVLVNSVDFAELKPYLGDYEEVISRYVLNQLERRSYTVRGDLRIKFAVDDDLGIGFFQIIVVSSTPVYAAPAVEERKSIFPRVEKRPSGQPPSGRPAVVPPLGGPAFEPAPAPLIAPDLPSATRIFDNEESAELMRAAAPIQPEPRPRTIHSFLIRNSDGAKIPLTRPVITIGRSKQNDLPIDSESVSRKHAEIVMRDGKYMLVDMGSTNGTLVNGERITSVRLKNGDIIDLSTERFRFVTEEHE